MNMFYCAYYLVRRRRASPWRYADLLRAFFESGARRIVEIGTNTGVHARHLIQTAQVFHPAATIEYHGFDLFEQLTPELLKSEFALPPRMVKVRRE